MATCRSDAEGVAVLVERTEAALDEEFLAGAEHHPVLPSLTAPKWGEDQRRRSAA